MLLHQIVIFIKTHFSYLRSNQKDCHQSFKKNVDYLSLHERFKIIDIDADYQIAVSKCQWYSARICHPGIPDCVNFQQV